MPTKRFNVLSAALFSLLVALVITAEVAQAADSSAEASPWIRRVRFEGNRKVEDAAMRSVITTRAGERLNPRLLASDVKSLWQLSYFEDIQVHAVNEGGGVVVVFIVREKPSIHKILIKGNDEVDLDKINEVLDLKLDAILDVAQVKRNAEKIRDVYIEKGFYLATVNYRMVPSNQHQIDIWFDIEENAKVEIRQVTFVGNRVLSADTLKSVMGTQEGGYLSFITSSGTYQESAFERDLMLLTALYYDHGYINVKISSPRVVLSPDKRYMYISIYIEEGQQFRLGKLDVKGDLLWGKNELLSSLKIRSKDIFNRSVLGQDVLVLTDRYKDRGYAYVNIAPLTNVDTEKRIVDLTFDVQKGPVVMFERINIRGNSKTRDKVIRRELKIAEGDRYSQTLMDRSKGRVNALGFFETVDISTSRGSGDDRIIVNIEVKERPTGTFQIGAGFSSVESFIAQAQVSQNNLFGRGQRLTLQAQVSGLRQLFSLGFWEPYFLDSNWTFGFDIYNSIRAREAFSRSASGGNLTWGYPITDDIRVYLTYTGEYVKVTSGNGLLLGGTSTSPLPQGVQLANLQSEGFTSSMRFSVQWDTRNNRLFPTKGFYHSAWSEFASPAFGSQNVFNRYGAFTRWFYPLWGPFVFRVNAQVGWVTSSDERGVPISERFLVGGIMDVRGFRPQSLGPRVPVLSSVNPNATTYYFNKGGNKELVFNAEIEFPIFEKVGIKGVVFTDAGNAFDDEDPISPVKLRHSAGWGIRWFSPIGPLRFEWGVPFAPKENEDAIVFEFTIGNFF